MLFYRYAAIGPASSVYEVCEDNNPSFYQDYGKKNHTIVLLHPYIVLHVIKHVQSILVDYLFPSTH